MKYFLIGLGLGVVLITALWWWRQNFNISIDNTNQIKRTDSAWKIIDKKPKKTSLFKEANPEPKTVWAPILNYHYIRENPDQNDSLGYSLSVTPENFAKQLNWLSQNNYTAITLDDLSAAFDNKKALPAKPVILTFDDGYRDFYLNGFPLLKAKNMKAIVFVVANFLNDKEERYLTSQQIVELSQSGQITIGSHSLSHANLVSASFSNAKVEIYESKKQLEKLTGRAVVHFAYPSGKYSETIAGLVKLAGYKTAVSTQIGSYHLPNERYFLKRVRISGNTDLVDLAEKLSPNYETTNKKSSSE